MSCYIFIPVYSSKETIQTGILSWNESVSRTY
jgi:hypothetical protein